MIDHVSIARMNQAIDGELTASDIEALERHLLECPPCRDEYALLSETVRAARSAPKVASAPESVWLGISERLGDRVGESAEGSATVLPLPSGGSAPPRSTKRFALSATQLAAAAGLVALVSGTVVWATLDGPRLDTTPRAESSRPSPGGAAARAASTGGTRYADTVDQLQLMLDQGSASLAPEVLMSIEESLSTLDAAIAEIEAAIGEDPTNDLLGRLLVSRQRTKLTVLRRAVTAVQSRT